MAAEVERGRVMAGDIIIRVAREEDRMASLEVERAAFGDDRCAELVDSLLDDSSAAPLLSLVAWRGEQAVGHILFTAASIEGAVCPVSVSLLAPLAVIPEAQGQGIGGMLIAEGLKRLTEGGVDLVFVLGHPGYYPRAGFQPAGVLGLEATYAIPPKNAGAWMVQELRENVIGSVSGRVLCANAIDKPEYWRE